MRTAFETCFRETRALSGNATGSGLGVRGSDTIDAGQSEMHWLAPGYGCFIRGSSIATKNQSPHKATRIAAKR